MYSSTTPTLKLPQWGENDHPDFLGEMNDAYMSIDIAITDLKKDNRSNIERITAIENNLASINQTLIEMIGGKKNE